MCLGAGVVWLAGFGSPVALVAGALSWTEARRADRRLSLATVGVVGLIGASAWMIAVSL